MNLKKLLRANAPRKLSDNIQEFNKHPGRHFVALLFVASLVFSDLAVFAQSGQNPQATPAPVQETQDAPKIPNEQLDSLVAPIALYPDPLLSQVLVASTYPLELIQLQQWLHKTGQSMNETARAEAVKQEDWDPSIQAMAVLPEVVKQLSANIKWVSELGNAFLAQQGDVMDAVQRMRTKAKDAGKLQSTEQMKVETEEVESKTVVVIEQANPEVVYVPSYDPALIWGTVGYYPYPPIYYPPYAGLYGFGLGIAIGAAWGGGWGWGCGWGATISTSTGTTTSSATTTETISTGEIGSIPSVPVTNGSIIHNIAVALHTQVGISQIGLGVELAGIRFPTGKRMRARISADRPAPWTGAVLAVAIAPAWVAAAWAGTASAAETFREAAAVNGAAALSASFSRFGHRKTVRIDSTQCSLLHVKIT